MTTVHTCHWPIGHGAFQHARGKARGPYCGRWLKGGGRGGRGPAGYGASGVDRRADDCDDELAHVREGRRGAAAVCEAPAVLCAVLLCAGGQRFNQAIAIKGGARPAAAAEGAATQRDSFFVETCLCKGRGRAAAEGRGLQQRKQPSLLKPRRRQWTDAARCSSSATVPRAIKVVTTPRRVLVGGTSLDRNNHAMHACRFALITCHATLASITRLRC